MVGVCETYHQPNHMLIYCYQGGEIRHIKHDYNYDYGAPEYLKCTVPPPQPKLSETMNFQTNSLTLSPYSVKHSLIFIFMVVPLLWFKHLRISIVWFCLKIDDFYCFP